MCVEHETPISQMRYIVEIFSYEIREINSTNRDMRNYTDSCHKESERCAAYLQQITVNFENVSNITIDSDNVITKDKQNWGEKYCQTIPYNTNKANKSIEEIVS